MDEERYIICKHCNGIIRDKSKKCVYCDGLIFFDSLDILDILRARIYSSCNKLDFHAERIQYDEKSHCFFTKLIICISVFSTFLFVLVNFTDNGLYLINRCLGEKIELLSIIQYIPFEIFYISLLFFLFSKFQLHFKCKGIDADVSRRFITYQHSNEFKKDFPLDEMGDDFSFYYDKLRNKKIRKSTVDFIVNGNKSAVEEKIKLISGIDKYLSETLEDVNDWKNHIYDSILNVTFSIIGNIFIFFIWYLIISFPFWFIFHQHDHFFIDISFLTEVKLFIHGSSPDVLQVFISPLTAGIIFGCLCGIVKSINEIFFFLQKKNRLDYICDIREQLVPIKERLNRLRHNTIF